MTRLALSRYRKLRSCGGGRVAVLGAVKISAGAIAADNATGIGVADDVLLIPLAAVAIGTYIITDAVASQDKLGQAWNQTLDLMSKLGVVTATVAMALDDIEGECHEKFIHCLENPWQPEWNREQFGTKKSCRDCLYICKRSGGHWPEDKCPR